MAASSPPEPKEVKVYGAWGSAHAAMARNALALKGVPYEYVEEDLEHKSEALLRLNPVHQKVPVLLVDGRPLAESLVIIEYVDETWPERDPPLLPRDDPRQRAAARFWAGFFRDRVSPLSHPVLFAGSEAGLVREMKERMAVLEAGIQEDFPCKGEGDGPFVHGRRPGLLDVVLGSCAAGTRVLSSVAGEEILEPGKMPRVHASVAAFDELAERFGTTVPHEKLLARLLDRHARRSRAATSGAPETDSREAARA